MSKPLIIVESPTKAKTISKFLDGKYLVEASFGHVRDLPKNKLSIDVEHGFTPKYVIPPKAQEQVDKLKKLAQTAPEIILASDEDREGEAIAWHLVQALGLDESRPKSKKNSDGDKTDEVKVDARRVKRIVFHEITKTAIDHALANPRSIDQNMVDAQQARRILDRLVGYELSPFLWRKIRYGLSAGRVQSVAVRLVVEREREINAFLKEEYWSIEAKLSKSDKGQIFTAKLSKIDEKTVGKLDIHSELDASAIVSSLNGATYKVIDVQKKEAKRNPSPPFTTSTLQQEAARKLGFSAKQTMMIAQQLYEQGHITYMRTDSVNLSNSSLLQAQEVISAEFGKQYGLPQPRYFANKSKGAQEAHEAIRPTNLSLLPQNFKTGSADKGHKKLYDLIWKRTIASQMQQAIFDQTAVDIEAKVKNSSEKIKNHATFRATGQVVKFDGFIRAYTEGKDEEGDEEGVDNKLPELIVAELLNLHELLPMQHFTEPPARYTDASLVKALEAHGIGRPSTYAPTLATIQERDYVTKEDKKYAPTEVGFLVNDMLVENFPEIVDINFTAKVEEDFDKIEEGQEEWEKVIQSFYTPFKAHLKEKEETVEKKVEVSNVTCQHCGEKMLIKFGRMGKFLACPDPESKITQPLPEEAAKIAELTEKTKGEKCPICNKDMEVKRGRFGYFLGCIDYPKCKGISKIWNKTGFKCPECTNRLEAERSRSLIESPSTSSGQLTSQKLIGDIVEKKGRGRGKPFYACTRWPDCEFIFNIKPESEEQVKEQHKLWLENKSTPRGQKGAKAKASGKGKKTTKKVPSKASAKKSA